MTVQNVLKKNSIDITDEKLLQMKYDSESVWGYVEVFFILRTSLLIHYRSL